MKKDKKQIIILIILLILLSIVGSFRALQWMARTDLELNTKLANFTDKIDEAIKEALSTVGFSNGK